MTPPGPRSSEANSKNVPAWLRGVWRRTYYRTADGVEDRSSSVYWLQTEALFADIRLPEPVLGLPRRARLGDYGAPELSILAMTRGFAGQMVFDEGIGRWYRPIDFQPETGDADVGHLRLEGDELWEHGAEVDYVETWQRVTAGTVRLVALSLVDESRSGILVVADDWMIRALGRPQALPPGPSLQQLVEKRLAAKRALDDVFDCEISLTQGGSGLISLSTQPWSIGKPFAAGGFHLLGDDLVESLDSRLTRTWTVRQSTEPLPMLLRSLNNELSSA